MKSKLKKKRAGRKRRAAGWTLLVLGVVVAGVWVASRWWCFRWLKGGTLVYYRYGSVGLSHEEDRDDRWDDQVYFLLERDVMSSVRWKAFVLSRSKIAHYDLYVVAFGWTADFRYIALALWPIPLLLWSPAALLLRSGIIARRRAMSGLCKECGYNLAGLPAGSPCPECGKGAGTK